MVESGRTALACKALSFDEEEDSGADLVRAPINRYTRTKMDTTTLAMEDRCGLFDTSVQVPKKII